MFVSAKYNSSTYSIFRVIPSTIRQLQISQEYLTESVSDSSVVTAHPLATELTLTTQFNTSAAAQAEATRQLNLRKVTREYYKATYFQGAITTPGHQSSGPGHLSPFRPLRRQVVPGYRRRN